MTPKDRYDTYSVGNPEFPNLDLGLSVNVDECATLTTFEISL